MHGSICQGYLCIFLFYMRFMMRLTSRNAVMQFVLLLLKCQCIHCSHQVIVLFSQHFKPKMERKQADPSVSNFNSLSCLCKKKNFYLFFCPKKMDLMNCSVMKSKTRSRLQSELLFSPFSLVEGYRNVPGM